MMNWSRRAAPTRRGVLVGLCGALAGITAPGLAMAQSVKSLNELRQHQVFVQEFDISCAAAALATLLTYQHGDPVSEREIALGLIDRPEYIANPALIRLREGFSLLDLKRFVDKRGYEGIGFGQLSYENLLEHAPIIVPLDLHGFRHFVIFRGELGGSVLLADPAYGNRTMSRERFERAWIDFPQIGRVGFVVERRDGLIPPNHLEPTLAEFLVLR